MKKENGFKYPHIPLITQFGINITTEHNRKIDEKQIYNRVYNIATQMAIFYLSSKMYNVTVPMSVEIRKWFLKLMTSHKLIAT